MALDAARGEGPARRVAEIDGLARLTRCERRVLELLAQGLAPKQAAWHLHVAITTVRSHIAAAKRKTGARTLHQLVGMFVDAVARGDEPGGLRTPRAVGLIGSDAVRELAA